MPAEGLSEAHHIILRTPAIPPRELPRYLVRRKLHDMSQRAQVGVFIPTREAMVGAGWSSTGQLIDFARRAEDLGYDSAWVTDSLAITRLEPLSVLTATAAATSRLLIGTGTLIPAYRQPLNAAHVISTIDRLSEGRLVLGVGAGFPGRSDRDFRMVGVPPNDRFRLLDDIVALWRALWTEPRATTFRGAVLSYDDLPEIPLPHRRGGPRIWLAGATPAALRRTARLYDGWLRTRRTSPTTRAASTRSRSRTARSHRP